MRLLLSLLFATGLMAETKYVSTNFDTDLYGKPDTRPYTWGMTDAITKNVVFHPPDGKIVVIDSIKGTVNAFLEVSLPAVDPHVVLTASGLFGLQNTAPEGSTECDPCASNTPLYLQFSITPKVPVTLPFSYKYKDGFRLLADNTLVQVMATFLNEIGIVHAEASYTIGFHYEVVKESQ